MNRNLSEIFQYNISSVSKRASLFRANGEFRIAIVGCGAAGVSTLFELLKELPSIGEQKVKIVIFEKGPAFGPGFAYQCDSKELLMNMISSTTSIIQNQENDFWNWVIDQGCHFGDDQIFSKAGIAPDGYVSRQYFGAYLRSRLEKVTSALEKLGIETVLINMEVLNIVALDKNRFKVIFPKNCSEEFNCIILCTGNEAPEDIFKLKGASQYVNNPYPTTQYLQLIKRHESVGIIGGQLTAADIAVVLANQSHQGPIYFFTRENNFPLIRSRIKRHDLKYLTLSNLNKLREKNEITIRSILRLARKEFLATGVRWNSFFKPCKEEYSSWIHSLLLNESNFSSWQSFAIETDSVIGEYWNSLSNADKSLFTRKFHRSWSTKRVPLPKHTALKLLSLFRLGILRHYSNLQRIDSFGRNKFVASISCPQKSVTNNQIFCDWVINASGPSKSINGSESVLIKNLLESGLVAKNLHGGISLDYESSLVMDANGERVNNFYAIGQITAGTYYFVSSLDMVSLRAKAAVNHLITRLGNDDYRLKQDSLYAP